MEYNSFYGGKRGAAFVIVEKFNSIENMRSNFATGGNYTTVKYDEYVIIDTENKNDPTNGMIFRRGYDIDLVESIRGINYPTGGGIYCGQIVGPGGLAPTMEMGNINEIKNMTEIEGFNYRHSSGELTVAGNTLIPGKQGSTYNDSIKYACCSIRDEYNKDTVAYVGFTVPYLVTEWTAASVSAYTTGELATRVDDQSHPFYQKWSLKVPKGLKGDAFQNLRIMIADSSIEDYTGKNTDITNKAQVLVYDYIDYTTSAAGVKKTIYLGKDHTIKSLDINEETGIMTVVYNDGTSFTKQVLYSWTSVAGPEDDAETISKAERLSAGGIWFIVEE